MLEADEAILSAEELPALSALLILSVADIVFVPLMIVDAIDASEEVRLETSEDSEETSDDNGVAISVLVLL